jgi:hypothetical protein
MQRPAMSAVALLALVGALGFDILDGLPPVARPVPPKPKEPKRSRHEIVQEFVYSGVSHSTVRSGATWACPRCPFERHFGTFQGAITKATEHVIAKHPEVGA